MDGKQLIIQANQIAMDQGLSQAEWSRRSGYDEFGKIISNTLKRGDCKLKVMTQLLKPLGCELVIVKKDEGKREKCCPLKGYILVISEGEQSIRSLAPENVITQLLPLLTG